MRTEFEIQLAVVTFAGGVNDWRTPEGEFDLIFSERRPSSLQGVARFNPRIEWFRLRSEQ
jgi:hypothetical protein